MISRESLDRLDNLDDILIVEHVVPADPHRLVLGARSPHKCIPDQKMLYGLSAKTFLTSFHTITYLTKMFK